MPRWLLACAAVCAAQDLTEFRLEDLMNIDVTSVSKKSQKLSRVPAAVYVLTQEDIRRSGAASIPEALRMVPGLQVARISANTWAVTARGFNGQYSNKLLVMIDGRSIYTQVFSGVFWESRDLILEDIERIEVIRGPGATVWGANAVNGVINIITKPAADTAGGFLSTTTGDYDRAGVTARYGGKAGQRVAWRAFGKKSWRSGRSLDDRPAMGSDLWRNSYGGGRLDFNANARDSLTFEGSGFQSRIGNVGGFVQATPLSRVLSPLDIRDAGEDAMIRWRRQTSETSEFSLQAWADHYTRRINGLRLNATAVDVDLQHRFAAGNRHDLMWGGQVRRQTSDFRNSFAFSFVPPSNRHLLVSGFFQDEISLVPDKLLLTLGSKVERASYTGVEWEPGVRLLWTPGDRHAVWASVARSVRTPAFADRQLSANLDLLPLPGGMTGLVRILGSPAAVSERALSYEAGYRMQAAKRVGIDIASFYNSYQRLATTDAGEPFVETDPLPPHLVLPNYIRRGMYGETSGLEIATHVELARRWRISTGHTFLNMQLHLRPDARAGQDASTEGDSPSRQTHLRSYLDLPKGVEWDAAVYRVGSLRTNAIPAYTRIDTRIGWRINERVELRASAANLLNHRHIEYVSEDRFNGPRMLGRTVSGGLLFRF